MKNNQTDTLTEMRCDEILDWADEGGNEWFDIDFIESVLERIQSGLTATGKQKESIASIHRRFVK